MTKKYKVYQWELFENYFKMPSSNEIDNCAVDCLLCSVDLKLSSMAQVQFRLSLSLSSGITKKLIRHGNKAKYFMKKGKKTQELG